MKKLKHYYIETYGCQMNVSDSEIVASILTDAGYHQSADPLNADVLLINTCSIRENAEDRVRKRLMYFRSLKKKRPGLMIGLLGCMADRLQTALIEEEQLPDLVAGPDSYRHLPLLLEQVETGQKAIDTILSADETYAGITPVRYDSNGISAYISIMRGCENFCSYCVVPYTRGQERSRDAASILREAGELFGQGYREVTLLGQNVNSYCHKQGTEVTDFTGLLEQVALISPLLRVRFATSHPKDIPDRLLETMARHENICHAVHLPVQSGSNRVLDRMNRKYTRERYMDRISAIRNILPGCAISTDIITGFCDETEEDHQQTLSLMEWVPFDFAYMFRYSERPFTLAADTLKDNVPTGIKERRLKEIIDLQQRLSLESNRKDIGKTFTLLVEGRSKRSENQLSGRTSGNKMVVFPKNNEKPGDYVNVKIISVTAATLIGEAVRIREV
ncbi:MAG TPA: tRNA (N6-isopentenyl adenosine(37)-C2)-methylthiotransferase MiaB [Bacteroidales bacterium]|nr:tRNA (N6-isopentenyl adenosine(37)-C2)-methylthiotransferase MiaB [Bacteroidales bacterium]HPT08785.1 tRNA (N6-isopentenyl adenosine(37)-C2)-methylthiotransferase MiaB [Bacteroidales bacterium]